MVGVESDFWYQAATVEVEVGAVSARFNPFKAIPSGPTAWYPWLELLIMTCELFLAKVYLEEWCVKYYSKKSGAFIFLGDTFTLSVRIG
jgi:hypothetical protein